MRKFLTQIGFSVGELTITISVIAIMAVVGAPSLSRWMDNYRIKAAARELYSNIQLTKSQAIKTSQPYKIWFHYVDTDGWSAYYVFQCKKTLALCWPDGGVRPDDWDYTWNYVSWDSDGRIQFKHPQGLPPIEGQWDSDVGVITFNPNGTTDGTADVYIANHNNTKNYRVRIPSRSGVVVVERYDGSGSWR